MAQTRIKLLANEVGQIYYIILFKQGQVCFKYIFYLVKGHSWLSKVSIYHLILVERCQTYKSCNTSSLFTRSCQQRLLYSLTKISTRDQAEEINRPLGTRHQASDDKCGRWSATGDKALFHLVRYRARIRATCLQLDYTISCCLREVLAEAVNDEQKNGKLQGRARTFRQTHHFGE